MFLVTNNIAVFLINFSIGIVGQLVYLLRGRWYEL